MKIAVMILFSLSVFTVAAQPLRDFKTKTESNETERTQMLDQLRNDTKNRIKQEVGFVVKHFNVHGDYAWMEGTVQRKDGKPLTLPDEYMDCCHIEALFKRVNGSWLLKDHKAFSADVWYMCLLDQYTDADKIIFPEEIRESVRCN